MLLLSAEWYVPPAICSAIVGFAKTPIRVLRENATSSLAWNGDGREAKLGISHGDKSSNMQLPVASCQLPVERQNSLPWPLSFSMRVSRRLSLAFLSVRSLVTITQ